MLDFVLQSEVDVEGTYNCETPSASNYSSCN